MTSRPVRRTDAHRRRHLRRPAARRTWRRSTASTRARCSGMTQGLEAGVTEVNVGPDGAIYVGGLGAGGNWGQAGKLDVRPAEADPERRQHLRHPGDAGHRRTASRSSTPSRCRRRPPPRPGRASTGSSSGGTCRPPAYGGPKVDEETLTVTSATLSADGKKVTLAVNGLQAGRVVYVRSPRPFTSTTGQSLWSTEAWYTLNAIPGGASADEPGAGQAGHRRQLVVQRQRGPGQGGQRQRRRRQHRQVVLARRAASGCRSTSASSQTVNRFVVKHAGAGGENTAWNTRDFTLQVSTNGTTWTTVATVTGNTASTTTHNVDRGVRPLRPAEHHHAGATATPRPGSTSSRRTAPAAAPAAAPAPSPAIGGKCVDVEQLRHRRRHEDPAVDLQRHRPRSSGAGSATPTGRWASASTSTTAAPPTAPRCSCGPATAAPRRSGSRRPTARS